MEIKYLYTEAYKNWDISLKAACLKFNTLLYWVTEVELRFKEMGEMHLNWTDFPFRSLPNIIII